MGAIIGNCLFVVDRYFAGLPDKEMAAMELGLAHSLSRYKLKFSPDKIETMIVQVKILLLLLNQTPAE